MSFPVFFSAPADAWLDSHPEHAPIVYAWAFAAGGGRAELGRIIRGYVPEVRYVELTTELTRTGLTFATHPRRIVVMRLTDLDLDPPQQNHVHGI